jgi:phosphohistidine phosphatase SixA
VRLFVIRHAKALPQAASPTGSDDDRPLAPRGYEQAAFLAERFSSDTRPPTHAFVSPILRAQQTAHAIFTNDPRTTLITDPRLSTHAGLHEHLDLIDELAARAQREPSVAIIAHNPTLELLVSALLPDDKARRMRTGECHVLDVDIERPHHPRTDARLVDSWRLDSRDD